MKQKLSSLVAFVLTFVMALSLLSVTPIFGDDEIPFVPGGPEHRVPLIRMTVARVGTWESAAGGHRVDVRLYLDYNPAPGLFSMPGFLMPGVYNADGEFQWEMPNRDPVTNTYLDSIVFLESTNGFASGPVSRLFTAPSYVVDRCWQRAVWQANNTTYPHIVTFYNDEGDEVAAPITGFVARFRYYVPADVGEVVFRYGPNPVLIDNPNISPYIRFGNGGSTYVEFDWYVDVVYTVEGFAPPERHTVTFEVVGNGTVSPATIQVDDGATITEAQLPTVTPGVGYSFTGWPADLLTTPITGPITITVTFEEDTIDPVYHAVTFAPGANGTIPAGATVQVREGEAITAAQVPAVEANTGFSHVGWSPSNPVGHIVTGAVTFTATYQADDVPVYHTVTFAPGANGSFAAGATTTVQVREGTAITAAQVPGVEPNTGFTHLGWTPANPVGFTVNEAVTFTATYQAIDVPPAPRVIGDVNNDGVIDDTDLTYIRTHITFYPGVNVLGENAFFADINGDGTVTLADLMILRDFIYSYEELHGTRTISTDTAISERITHHRNIGRTTHQ